MRIDIYILCHLILPIFKEYSKETRFLDDTKERSERKQFFKRLTQEELSELNFSEMIKKLWASQIWGNKEYLINKLIKDNSFEKLKTKLSYIFSKNGSPRNRYESLVGEVKGMGPSIKARAIQNNGR